MKVLFTQNAFKCIESKSSETIFCLRPYFLLVKIIGLGKNLMMSIFRLIDAIVKLCDLYFATFTHYQTFEYNCLTRIQCVIVVIQIFFTKNHFITFCFLNIYCRANVDGHMYCSISSTIFNPVYISIVSNNYSHCTIDVTTLYTILMSFLIYLICHFYVLLLRYF